MLEQIISNFLFILKVLGSFYLSGILLTGIIWPHNEQDTTKFQWILGVVVVIVLNYFIWS